ncbi:MAG TPA: PLP-dependent aminotransferase family protein [Jiangellaceae bacterium]
MEDSWAISDAGPEPGGSDLYLDLHLNARLDPGAPGLRAQLEHALRDAVRTGRLAALTRLPSSRSLARDLGIARNTVADAYAQLVAEGWLTARQGAGTRVAERIAPDHHAPSSTRVPEARAESARYDLGPGSPDLSSFPRAAWLSATRRAITAAPSDAFGYPDPRGRPELRQAVAQYLARARGVRASIANVVVCSGYADGLALLSTTLRATGLTTLAVESFGLDVHRRIVEVAGLDTVPLTVDDHGARIDELPGGPADAVLLTPAHQFPRGVPLAPGRRSAVIDWARSTGGLVIEDDYDGEFRYDRQPVGALQSLDPDRVVYAGTVSKSLAPGVRLGWLVMPSWLAGPVIATKSTAQAHSGVIDQLALADLVDSGAYDRHVRRSRLHYRRRRDRLTTALAERAPGVRVRGISAGLHVLVELDEPEDDVEARAAPHGLVVRGLDRYRHPAAPPAAPALVLGYATPPEHAFAGALDALSATLAPRRPARRT